MTTTWLGTVAQFLGCDISQLDPTKVYFATAIVLSVLIFSIAYILGRIGRK